MSHPFRARSRVAASCLAVALCVGVAACGGDGNGGDGRTSLTIYSSLPLQGDARERSESISKAEKLALEEVNGKVGKFTIKLVTYDAATAAADGWDPGQTSTNARRAAQDPSTIAYLGDSDSGGSEVSIPILNQAGILQISPSSTYVGLTRADGEAQGEPEKYYPSGRRTFGRVVPADHVQAAAQVSLQEDEGCTQLFVLSDDSVAGKGLAGAVEEQVGDTDVAIAATVALDPGATSMSAVAAEVADSGADCLFFGGDDPKLARDLFRAVHEENRTLKLFGGSGLAREALLDGLGRGVEERIFLTTPALSAELSPPAGQEFETKYQQKYGVRPDPYAAYGYEAMKAALLAIERAGAEGNERQAVIDAFFNIKNRESVLGKYSIDENGDTTRSEYGVARVRDGELVVDERIDAR